MRGRVPLRAASARYVRRMCVLGVSFAGSCAAAGCKPTARSAHVCAWGFRLRGHVPLRAASPQHVRRMCVLGDSFAGSCSAAGCKPTARLAPGCAWGFVCGDECSCRLQPMELWTIWTKAQVCRRLLGHSLVWARQVGQARLPTKSTESTAGRLQFFVTGHSLITAVFYCLWFSAPKARPKIARGKRRRARRPG